MPLVLLKTHQPTLETVASLVQLELRPFQSKAGAGVVARFVQVPAEIQRVIHRSDVLFWVEEPERTGWLLNGLPRNVIDSGMVKFAGLALEPNQLTEIGRVQETARQVVIKGRANVINYTRDSIPALMPLVMGKPDLDPVTDQPDFHQGQEPRRLVAALRPAFPVKKDGRDAQWFTEQYTTLPVSQDLVYVSMKLHRAPGLEHASFPASSFLAPQRRSYYPEIKSLVELKGDTQYWGYQFDVSETSRSVVKNLFFFETVMDFIRYPSFSRESRFERVRKVVRKHVQKRRLPRLAVHLDLGVVPLFEATAPGLRFEGPLPNLYRIIASSLYVTPPGATMAVHL